MATLQDLDDGTPGPPDTPLRMEAPLDRSSSPDSDTDTDMDGMEKGQSLHKQSKTQPTTGKRVRFFPTIEGSSPHPLDMFDSTSPLPQITRRTQQPGPNRSNHTLLLNSNLPQKRPTSTPEAPHPATTQSRTPEALCPGPTLNKFSFTAQRLAALTPCATTAEEAIAIARNMVIQAFSLVSCTKKQSQLLDLLEVFRDFTENGRVNKHGLSVLASQVASLETVSRTIGTKIRQLQKPSTTTPSTSPQPMPKPPTPTLTSYAATAARAQPTTSDWQQVTKKSAAPQPKNSLNNRQLVLIQESQVLALENHPAFDPLALCNAFNLAFANKGVTGPVVASVTSSKRENIVLTTTPAFTAKYLLEKVDIWQHITHFKEALPIQPWSCNADGASALVLPFFFPGEPVGVANNLKAIVEGWDFLLEDRETLIGVEGSWTIVDGDFEPGLDREGFLEVGDVLPDVDFFKKVLCSEGRSGSKDNVLEFAGGD
jgi:hypothetical protein